MARSYKLSHLQTNSKLFHNPKSYPRSSHETSLVVKVQFPVTGTQKGRISGLHRFKFYISTWLCACILVWYPSSLGDLHLPSGDPAVPAFPWHGAKRSDAKRTAGSEPGPPQHQRLQPQILRTAQICESPLLFILYRTELGAHLHQVLGFVWKPDDGGHKLSSACVHGWIEGIDH